MRSERIRVEQNADSDHIVLWVLGLEIIILEHIFDGQC